MFRRLFWPPLLFVALATVLHGGGPSEKDPYADRIGRASDDWKKTVQRMQLPAGVKADLWAAEPHVANIVSFAFDEKGRCYVAETFRLHAGVTDNRSHMYWLDDDLACRTVADRIALYKKHLKGKFASYARDTDRVRLVEDTTGAGRADKATVFADGFSRAEDGLGSGVLARAGNVYYTNIPDLWLLKDTKGTGHADVKKSLHTGYGVHVSFIGHDMHGLRMGPDGKLYFSIGDRGLHVEKDGKTLASAPDTGAVLRCNPDGSELEIVATGLRNPQELAFDEFGNLFTGDNNADGGDKARWVYIVEGGDSGWRIGYQYMPGLGPWNSERLWHTQATNTGSYLVPPLDHIANGPSGLTYHPGTSLLPEKYQKHFFLCDFRGSGGGSGVHSFALKPKGAAFELTDRHQFAWGVLATDCDFGPDGGFYISDWVDGWGLTGKGRIWRLHGEPPASSEPPASAGGGAAETKALLAQGFDKRPTNELVKLLGHKDMRVRQEAQFALADRKEINALMSAAREGTGLARLHGIWGIGQIGRNHGPAIQTLLQLARDKDAEVRAQSLKVLGDVKFALAPKVVLQGLKDAEPRVRFYAAIAVGKYGDAKAAPTVVEMLKQNADADPYLRHAGVMALAGLGKDAIGQAADDPSPSVRLAGLLAMRSLGSPEISRFLKDTEPKLVLESARAIYDVPIESALPKLAELTRPGGGAKALPKDVQEPVLLRALAAHHRLGDKADAVALAELAASKDYSDKVRVEAVKLLDLWENPPGRDRVTGLWRPIGKRSGEAVADAIRPALAGIMTGPDKVRTEGTKLAAKHGIKEVGPLLRETVADARQPPASRIAALKALESLKDGQLESMATKALEGDDGRLRHEARRVLFAKSDPKENVKTLMVVVEKGPSLAERQGAIRLLGATKHPAAQDALTELLLRIPARKLLPELELDVLDAVRAWPELAKRLREIEGLRPNDKSVAAYRDALVGGDAEAGRAIFFDKAEVSCLRCHKVDGVGGEVGPDLSGIGAKQKREYLLESIVNPDKEIAKGYESVVLVLLDGQTKSGIVKSEDAKVVRLMNAEGQLISVAKDQIDERRRGVSAMPADLVQKMNRAELRDLVEFLAGLK